MKHNISYDFLLFIKLKYLKQFLVSSAMCRGALLHLREHFQDSSLHSFSHFTYNFSLANDYMFEGPVSVPVSNIIFYIVFM